MYHRDPGFLESCLDFVLYVVKTYLAAMTQAFQHGNWLGFIVLSVVGLVVIGVLTVIFIAICMFVYEQCDKRLTPMRSGTGTIVKRHKEKDDDFVPLFIPIMIFVYLGSSTERMLTLNVNGKYTEVEVNKKFYKSVSVGQLLNVQYQRGRFSGDVYIYNMWT